MHSKDSIPPIASKFGNGKGSILSRQGAPFALREGNLLVWMNVSMTLLRNKVCFLDSRGFL